VRFGSLYGDDHIRRLHDRCRWFADGEAEVIVMDA